MLTASLYSSFKFNSALKRLLKFATVLSLKVFIDAGVVDVGAKVGGGGAWLTPCIKIRCRFRFSLAMF